ncbi:integrase arm-type DNA-binding domain-containing protein [Aeromonas veronii]|uniref:integrase arm-type DNA-binding domain-containing protein n=1 Tax=Aeromonas veronii TaxID=654 RepID=UPI003BA09272
MTKDRLSDTKIKAAKPKEKEYTLADGEGLQLRVTRQGSKLWVFKYYRPVSKARTNIGLGTYPEITLAKACSGLIIPDTILGGTVATMT